MSNLMPDVECDESATPIAQLDKLVSIAGGQIQSLEDVDIYKVQNDYE